MRQDSFSPVSKVSCITRLSAQDMGMNYRNSQFCSVRPPWSWGTSPTLVVRNQLSYCLPAPYTKWNFLSCLPYTRRHPFRRSFAHVPEAPFSAVMPEPLSRRELANPSPFCRRPQLPLTESHVFEYGSMIDQGACYNFTTQLSLL